jgi:hypothetical protein
MGCRPLSGNIMTRHFTSKCQFSLLTLIRCRASRVAGRIHPHHRPRPRPRRRNPDPGGHPQRPRQPGLRPHPGGDCSVVPNRPAPHAHSSTQAVITPFESQRDSVSKPCRGRSMRMSCFRRMLFAVVGALAHSGWSKVGASKGLKLSPNRA